MGLFIRLTLYSLAVFFFRIIYVFTAYSMGFGSATDHTGTDILINIIFTTCNLVSNYFIMHWSKSHIKKELLYVSFGTIMLWVAFYIYYNYFGS